MDLSFLEPHPQRVLAAFRQGDFDDLEILGQADERDFFQRCFQEHLLERLAQDLPTTRKKQEVPRWFILAANLSLKLHQENSFLAFERVVRCGGLLAALPPELACQHLDKQTQRWVLSCQGFNHKNHYDRQTPCDHDTLRKALKDVPASQWLEWFNTAVQRIFQAYGFFDPEGIFIGDASYLFVPDNPAYQGSTVLWFDQHNHPVNYEALAPEEKKKAHRERCYKWISLLHLRGGCFVYAAVQVVSGQVHESQPLYELVGQFVRTVGPGVLKWLILDRGFIDGQQISRCKEQWGIDVVIPLKKSLDLWTDAQGLAQQTPWQVLPQPGPAAPTPSPARPAVLERREAQRQKTLAQQRALRPPPDPARLWTQTEYCDLTELTSWTAATVPLRVVLLRDTYADGQQQHWGLISTQAKGPAQQIVSLYGRRQAIEERHRQLKCFYDLSRFRSRSFNAITAQVVMVLLTYTLRQWQLWKWFEEELARLSPEQLAQRLSLHHQWVLIYLERAYAQLPLMSFTREVLQLEGLARDKALRKIQALEERLFSPMTNPRPS